LLNEIDKKSAFEILPVKKRTNLVISSAGYLTMYDTYGILPSIKTNGEIYKSKVSTGTKIILKIGASTDTRPKVRKTIGKVRSITVVEPISE
jgi:hypothetical protein